MVRQTVQYPSPSALLSIEGILKSCRYRQDARNIFIKSNLMYLNVPSKELKEWQFLLSIRIRGILSLVQEIFKKIKLLLALEVYCLFLSRLPIKLEN